MRWANVLGGTCLLLGVLIGFGADLALKRIDSSVAHAIEEQAIWRPDSPPHVKARYTASSATIHVRYYFFSITNVEAVRAGAKPELEEVGPFTYTKHSIKEGITFTNGTVSFRDYTYFLECPSLTPMPLDTGITTLNLPLVGALERISGYAPATAARWLGWLARAVEAWSGADVAGLFTTRTARELLWGYDDPLLARLHWLAPSLDPHFTIVHNVSSPEAAAELPVTTMSTGAAPEDGVWQSRVWRGLREITAWAPPHVERVRGGDGQQFAPGLKLGEGRPVWVGEAFRVATLVAEEETSLHGVPLVRMRTDPHQGDINPTYFQYIQGLMNITGPMASGPTGHPGKAGPPLFLSMPHFCGADPALAEGVVGLHCQPKKHKLSLDVEPNTGITVRGARRIQLSTWFGPKWQAIDKLVRDTYLPIFWADETSEASEKQMMQFEPLLWAQNARHLILQWRWHAVTGCVVTGALLLVFAATWPGRRRPVKAPAPGRVAQAGPATDVEAAPLLATIPEEIQPISPPSP